MQPKPIILKGQHVMLAPLSQNHCADLKLATAAGNMHQLWYTAIPHQDDMEDEIDRRLNLQEAGSMLAFATCLPSGQAVGMTTFMNIDAANRRVEIGSTWLGPSAQNGPVNTEAKRLMLTHAFEDLDCIAVEFRTHVINHQSRAAIERLGAKPDGILRSHMIMANGTIRDTAVYSIIACEWPTVKANLTWKLEQPRK